MLHLAKLSLRGSGARDEQRRKVETSLESSRAASVPRAHCHHAIMTDKPPLDAFIAAPEFFWSSPNLSWPQASSDFHIKRTLVVLNRP
ncbi:hypothetical protein E4U22_000484 [Claviceps purpurea]|nr:hypothetical protein E4U22_000484 [Claviceps purpurea]